MAKRKESEVAAEVTPLAKRRKSVLLGVGDHEVGQDHPPAVTPSRLRSILKPDDVQNGVVTPRSVRKVLFTEAPTPSGQVDRHDLALESPITKARRLDSSARRKSEKKLSVSTGAEDAVTQGEDFLAAAILNHGDETASLEDEIGPFPDTPTKKTQSKVRPRGRRKERSPTPPDDMPPHELYFFQNRAGGNKTSDNTLPSDVLLSHEDYFSHIKRYVDPHQKYIEHLSHVHRRSFEQWEFELDCGFSLCLYGYGSKRQLLISFADHLIEATSTRPTIIVVNGYTPTLVPKDILGTIAREILPGDVKLPAQPRHLTEAILAHLTTHPRENPIRLIIHSLDAVPLRKPSTQLLIAQLAAHPAISLIASVDTPTFPLLWPLPLLSSFRFLYHDTTTFRPYDAEITVVDDVNALLGRSGRRVGGRDGVTFVLRSLPENAQNLFRILVAEQLSLIEAGVMTEDAVAGDSEGEDELYDEDDETLLGFDEDTHAMDVDVDTPSRGAKDDDRASARRKKKKQKRAAPDELAGAAAQRRGERRMLAGVDYRAMYRKAVEDFVCSSEMGFRTLLKEFHDHQIVESRKDALGGERLLVPFGRTELEAILDELI